MFMQHEVAVPDAQRAQLTNLPNEWAAYQAAVTKAGSTLETAKENFREKVRGMVEHFSEEVGELANAFAATAPFTSEGFTAARARCCLFILSCCCLMHRI
jgi:hypothetical protein